LCCLASTLPALHFRTIMSAPLPLPPSPPLIIGATGGSGTRVVARIARAAGYDMGTHLNGAEDAISFIPFHDTWIDTVIEAQADDPTTPFVPPEAMVADFHQYLEQHLASAGPQVREPGARWGWKAPRTLLLLPFLHAQFPGMKFIHILRDGRDMAFSKNQNQLRLHGQALLSWKEKWFSPKTVQSILIWERANLRAAQYAEKHLGENYMTATFEDLCLKPEETTARILRFLGSPEVDAAELSRGEVAPPASVGRWRAQPPELIVRLEEAAGESLRKFGYLEKREG
jgi:hypothetical protein